MKKLLLPLSLALAYFLLQASVAAPTTATHRNADTPRMKQYWLVQLLRGTNRTHADSTAKRIQAEHIANIERLAKDGFIVMAGPMGYDKDWRGIFVMDAKDSATVAALVKTDPAISSGRLRFEIHPWWFQTGTYNFR